MAEYKRPHDPRDGKEPTANRSRGQATRPFPWLWIALGFIVTLVGIWGALWLVVASMTRPPLEVSGEGGQSVPTIIRLTAPPTSALTPTSSAPTPTSVATFTPVPTRDLAEQPDIITIGFFAQIVNTGGAGSNVRSGPGTSNSIVAVAPEESVVRIVDGPREQDEFTWWQFETEDGTIGWGAADFLTPSAEPEDWGEQ